MASHSGILSSIYAPSDPAPLQRGVIDPFRSWLGSLALGAAFAAAGFCLDAAWQFASLSARTQGMPTRAMLFRAFSPVVLATYALNWMAIWLLTTENPTVNRAAPKRLPFTRAMMTLAFLVVSNSVLQPFGDLRLLILTLLPGMLLVSSFTLTWIRLRGLAGQLQLSSVRWRAAVATILCPLCGLVLIGPQLLEIALGMPVRLTRDEVQLRLCILVLWSAISAIFMLRVTISLLSLRAGSRATLPASGAATAA